MYPVLVVWLALSLEKWLVISSSIDPLSFFRFICQQMANKVHKQAYSAKQLAISGTLALLVLIVPIVVIAYLLHAFASYQWLLDTLLLWVLIQYTQDHKLLNQGNEALAKNKNQLAKDLIQQKVLRNAQPLSSMGLAKASIESAFLRYHHQLFVCVACYLLFGPIAVLSYRLCYEAHQTWNSKLSHFEVFGRSASALTRLVQFVPAIVCSFTFILTSSPKTLVSVLKSKQFWLLLKQTIFSQNIHSLLLYSLSKGLDCNTGGPLMYQTKKYRRPRFVSNNANEPTPSTLKTLINLLNRHLIVGLVVTTWLVFWFSLH